MSPRTETELLEQTIELATLQGWLVHHDRPARTERGWRTAIQGHAGFPDLVLARGGVVLFRELKGPYGRLTPEQYDWSWQLDHVWRENAYVMAARTRIPFDVWRPCDWDSLIVPTLTGRLGRDAA